MTLWILPRPAQVRGTPSVPPIFSPARLFPVAIALLLSACAVVPITPQTISGKYEIEGRPEGLWNSGEAIVLGDGTFEYWLYTAELVDNPRSTHYPVRGRYKLDGATITFLNSSVPYPQRTLTRRHKLFVLWTPKQVQDYHDLGRKPDDLLYQHP